MSGKIINETSLTIPITPGRKLSQEEIVSDTALSNLVLRVITELTREILQLSNRKVYS